MGTTNPVIENILSRRSVRRYSDKPVGEDLIRAVIEAGMSAPSARNAQARDFTVVVNRDILERLNTAVKEMMLQSPVEFTRQVASKPGFRFYFGAPVLIIVSSTKEAFFPREDTGCAIENILLAAKSFDLGTCWVNQLSNESVENPAIQEILNEIGITPEKSIFGSVTMGYPEKMPEALPRKEVKINFID